MLLDERIAYEAQAVCATLSDSVRLGGAGVFA